MEEKLLEATNLAAAWSAINALHCEISGTEPSGFLIYTLVRDYKPLIMGSGKTLNDAALDFLKSLSK